MSRRAGAVSRIFVAVLSHGLALAVVLGALAAPAPAVAEDYALCFGDESGDQGSDQKEANVDQAAVDQRIAACTAIAEDDTQAQRQRIKA